MTITTTLTSSPTNPQRNDPDNFRSKADAYVDWHTQTNVPETNTIIAEINSTVDDINNTVNGMFVGTSSTSVTIGTGSKTFTMVEDTLAFAAGNNLRIAQTSNPTTNYMEGVVTSYNKTTKALAVTVSSTNGSGTITGWTMTLAPPIDFNRVRSWSGMTGSVSVPFIVSHDGAYWWLATNIADVTAKEPGVDSEWQKIGGASYEEFLVSGTWTKPAGCRYVYVEAIGGGGGGANLVSGSPQGGSGGEFVSKLLKAADVGATEIVSIGDGGDGGADTTDAAGSNGGNSSFGSHVEAYGGRGGPPSTDNRYGTSPLRAFSSSYTVSNAGGMPNYFVAPGGVGGTGSQKITNCVYGGAGGGSSGSPSGISDFAGNGGSYGAAGVPGGNGSVPGGGGGASANDGGGGNGGKGRVRVWTW